MMRAIICLLLTLSLTAAAAEELTVTGRVVGPDGRSIEGAHVGLLYIAEGEMAWADATSDADGQFALAFEGNLHPVQVGLAAVAEGYAVSAAEVTPGEPVEIVMSDQPTSVSGFVRGPDGEGVEGIRVEVHWLRVAAERRYIMAMAWEHVPATTSAVDGSFAIDGVPRGYVATLVAEGEGWARWRDLIARATAEQEDPVIIPMQPEVVVSGRLTRDGEPVPGIMIRMQEQDSVQLVTVVSGRLTRDGEPVPIRVQRRHSGAHHGKAVTDEAGEYTIRSLPAGTYNVAVDAPPEWTAVAHEGVELAPGDNLEDVDFEAIDGGIVRGTMTWEDTGEPVVDGSVAAYGPAHPASTGWMQVARTDEAGEYQMHLPPGSNQVYLFRIPEGGREAVRKSQTFDVVADAEHVLDFRVTRAPNILLRVLNADGTPAPGVDVYWRQPHEEGVIEPEPVKTDEAGEVEVVYSARSRPSQDAGVPALARDDERGLVALAMASAADAVTPLAHDEFEMTLQPAAELRVTVVDESGEPVQGVRMNVRVEGANSSSLLPIEAVTGEDGVARIAPLPPGVGLMVWTTPEHARFALDPATTRQEVTLEPAEVRELEPVVIKRGGFAVRGVVVNQAGDPVAGALVRSLSYRAAGQAGVTADAEGRFELGGLSADDGQFIVAVSPDGTFARAMAVDPRSAYELTLHLAPLGTIIATIVGADGQPVPGVRVEAWVQGSGSIEVAVADAEGRVRFENLVPGFEYSISVQDPQQSNRVLGNERVTLHGGEEPVEVRIELGIVR